MTLQCSPAFFKFLVCPGSLHPHARVPESIFQFHIASICSHPAPLPPRLLPCLSRVRPPGGRQALHAKACLAVRSTRAAHAESLRKAPPWEKPRRPRPRAPPAFLRVNGSCGCVAKGSGEPRKRRHATALAGLRWQLSGRKGTLPTRSAS